MSSICERPIRVHSLVRDSIVDGPGLRLTIFAQGCPRRCGGCHNPQTHDPSGGQDMTAGDILAQLNPMMTGVTLSGGEPLLQAEALLPLAREVRRQGRGLWMYTGYLWEDILSGRHPDWEALVRLCDVVVDGAFMQERRSLSLRFRGSENQRIIDVPKSLEQGAVIEWT